MSSDSTFICVLGMHRSGTSCLAGSLESQGVYFGDVQQANRYNARGNRENLDVNGLNEMVLRESGGSWHDPPSDIEWTTEHAELRDQLIEHFQRRSVGPWGIKDPRLTFTLPFWQEAIPELRIVASFRHPEPVAESLRVRNNFPREQSIAIWLKYNTRLLEHMEESLISLVSFDASDDMYRRSLITLFRGLGSTSRSPAPDFFEPKLRHHGIEAHTKEKPDLPASVVSVLDSLQRQYRYNLATDDC